MDFTWQQTGQAGGVYGFTASPVEWQCFTGGFKRVALNVVAVIS